MDQKWDVITYLSPNFPQKAFFRTNSGYWSIWRARPVTFQTASGNSEKQDSGYGSRLGTPPVSGTENDQSSCRFWGPTGPSLLISWSFDPHGKAYVELFASPIAGVGVRAFRSGAHAVVITSWALRNPETSTGFSWFLHLEKIKMLSPGVVKYPHVQWHRQGLSLPEWILFPFATCIWRRRTICTDVKPGVWSIWKGWTSILWVIYGNFNHILWWLLW